MFKYFKLEDFECSETGENDISHDFVHKLDELRAACGFPFHITSGFRSKNHSREKSKQNPGSHARGIAADIAVQGGAQRMKVVQMAPNFGSINRDLYEKEVGRTIRQAKYGFSGGSLTCKPRAFI